MGDYIFEGNPRRVMRGDAVEKMYETRILMVSQMQGVAKILECASKHQELSTNFEGESYIKAALDREGIKVREINVFEKDDETEDYINEYHFDSSKCISFGFFQKALNKEEQPIQSYP